MVSVQRHLALLRSTLQEGETERAQLRAERVGPEHSGALLLTERRLLFSGLGFFSQSQEAWPLALLTGVEAQGGRLVLHLLGAVETFTGRPRDVAAFAAALGPGKRAEQPGAETLEARTLVAQLERLAELRASGVLSEEEFRGAKQRLIR